MRHRPSPHVVWCDGRPEGGPPRSRVELRLGVKERKPRHGADVDAVLLVVVAVPVHRLAREGALRAGLQCVFFFFFFVWGGGGGRRWPIWASLPSFLHLKQGFQGCRQGANPMLHHIRLSCHRPKS